MARFQAGIQGNRLPITRLGSGKSGIYAFARGWKGGARIEMWEGQDEEDWINITVGTHDNVARHSIAHGPIEEVIAEAKRPKQTAITDADRFEALLDLLARMSDADTVSWQIRLVGQDVLSWPAFEDAIENRAHQIRTDRDPADPPYPPPPGVPDWERQGYEGP